jgi:transposase
MTAAAQGVAWVNDKVRREAISLDPAFKTRSSRLSTAHVKTLVAVLRRGSPLSPVLLWRQQGRNSFVLLDGEHRLAAYRSIGFRGGIPARIVTCQRRDALLIGAAANTRDALPLSQTERADVAWKLVREPEANFTKEEISKSAGISERTVTTMRARWRAFRTKGGEPSGRWWQDRVDSKEGEEQPMQMMSDAERRERVEAAAAKLRKAAGNLAFKDEQMFAEALDVAFGFKLRAAIDYLHAPEEVDEWAEMDVAGSDEVDDCDDDDSDF